MSAEEDYSSLPLTERVTHKIWKVRVSAYEELTKLFKKSDSESNFKPYESFMKNIATDANAVAQEAGLTTLLAFVENAPNPLRVRASIIPAVVEKGFGSSRAGTKNKAIELILLYIEVDSPDPVVEDVLEGLKAKQPKLVATTVNALKEIIRLYGAKEVKVKPILKTIPKIFAHTDKNVRSEGTQLVIELYKWLGKAIDPHLSELKPVQIKELNEAFEKLPQEKPKQERLLRSQVAAAEAAAEAGKGDDAEVEEEKEIDAYDLAEPVDVLSKVPKEFYAGLASSKWKERKEALESMLEICKTPKIADNNYSELTAALAKRITDANILVVTLAANVIEALALGLRESFSKYKTTVISPIIEKLKERKQSVIDALSAALDAVFLSVTISDITEDVLAAGKHKNPQVKSESMKWLVRCIKNTKTAPQKAEIKSLTEMMVKASEDSFEPVRNSAFEGLGTMMKVIGEKAMNVFLEGLDDIKKGKIKEYYDKAEVKIKFSAAKKPPPPAVAPSAPKGKPAEKTAAKKGAGAASKKEAAKPKKASTTKAPAAAAAAAAPPPKKGGKAKEEEVIKYKFSNEEVEEKFSELVPEDQTAELSEKNWKLRLAAIENLQSTLEEMDPSEIQAELVVRFLSKKPSWKESNFQVLSKAFNIIEMLSRKIPSFGKPTAALAIPILVEKLGDIKLKKSASDALMAFSEKISLQFVLSQAYDPLRKAKAPKTLADSLIWTHGAIMEFGITGLQVRELIEFLKFALSSSNASVRTNSVTVLGALRIFVGPDIRTFVQDLNPTQLATIDSEFEKVADQAPPKELKTSAEVAGDSGKNSLEELFPKVDIGAQFTSKLMAECNDDKWKVRKDALEQVLGIVDANKRIKPNLGDFVPILKARLGDSNKNLQMMALDITGKIATAMGKPFERHVKILVGPVTAVLTDQKATVRGSAIGSLDALANACGLDSLIGSFSTSLATENPLLRKDLLSWLSERLKEAAESDKKNALPDLSPMVQPILSCLQDRNGDVRKAAQACLGPIVKSAGYDYVVAKCGDLKGAVKQTIMPMIEAVRPTGPAKKDTKKVKSRLAAPSGKDKAEEEENMDDEPPAKLPPGLVLKPPTNSTLNKPTTPLANPLAANLGPTNGPSSVLTQPSGLPPSGISRLQSPAQRGGIPSGIGRGLSPSKLQFSRNRPGMNGANGQIPAAFNNSVDEIEPKKDLSSMEVDKSEHSMLVNNETNASLGLPPAKQRVFMVDLIIARIMSTEFQQSIEALKELDKHLNASPESIIPDVDQLVNALALQLRISYTQLRAQSQSLVRLCKHLVNALVLLFSNKDLASAVSQDSLDRLLSELAHRLLDPNLTAVDGGSQLSKAINVSMVKVLEHSNRNRTYSALISILGKSSSNLREIDAATATTQTKFTELIMKCLWKLAKSVQENLKNGTLLPNQLLRDLNNFFLATPPAEWKRRAAEKVALGEMPLRTVKTLLLELVTGLGENVYEHLDLIEDPQRSYVYPYLHHMLEATKKKDKQAGNQVVNQYGNQSVNHSGNQSGIQSSIRAIQAIQDITDNNNTSSRPSSISSARSISSVGSDLVFSATDSARASPSEPISPATPMTPKFPTPISARSSGSYEVEMNERLTQIFNKIGKREETKKGIYELYEFQKQHPEMEGKITTQLSKTGTHFQSYIRRGLANIATEEEEKERANVIAEAKRNLFPQMLNNSTENNINQSGEVAYKQKLLRLQQMFGYETANERFVKEINEENRNDNV